MPITHDEIIEGKTVSGGKRCRYRFHRTLKRVAQTLGSEEAAQFSFLRGSSLRWQIHNSGFQIVVNAVTYRFLNSARRRCTHAIQ